MKVQQIMERVGITETGRAIAYIKDGLEEMNLISSENIVKGSVASITGTGISFDTSATSADNLVSNGDSWIGSPGAGVAFTDWTFWESGSGLANTVFSVSGGKAKLVAAEDLSVSEKSGMYQAVTVTSGKSYKLKADVYSANAGVSVFVMLSNSLATDTNIVNDYSLDISDIGFNDIDGTLDINFTATAGTVYLYVYLSGTDDTLFAEIDNIAIYPIDAIKDSNSGFGSFASGMKVLVNGSGSNDTDESNTSSGYYTVSAASASQLILSEDRIYEAAGETITVRGQTLNYMDLIKDKRYYNLPSEAIKITDIRVKNHLNTKDQWRSIPRMIGRPLNTDVDEV